MVATLEKDVPSYATVNRWVAELRVAGRYGSNTGERCSLHMLP